MWMILSAVFPKNLYWLNIYILYVYLHIEMHSCGILYANDSILNAHDESPYTYMTMCKVNHHLDKVWRFYYDWDTKINPSKTETTSIRNASGKCQNMWSLKVKFKQIIIGVDIPLGYTIKYLGITFNDILKFNKHARQVLRKAYRILIILTNKDLPSKTILLLCKTNIKPLFLYAFPIWFSISLTTLMKWKILNGNFSDIYSNRAIYGESKMTPVGLLVCDLISNFMQGVRDHDM